MVSFRLTLSTVLCALPALLAIPVGAEESGAASSVTLPDESGWGRGNIRVERIRIGPKTAVLRYSVRVSADVAQSYGELKGALPPCVIPEPGFWRRAVPKLALEALVPELRVTRVLVRGEKSEPGLFAMLVRGTGIEVAAHYITEYLPGEMVASCARAYFGPEDGRYYRYKGIGVFARTIGDKEWHACPIRHGLACAIGESAWVNVPQADDVVLADLPEFRKFPSLRMEMLYRPQPFGAPVFLNWSKASYREGLLVIEYECVVGVDNCGPD
jgi:hypothetical protein